MNKYNGIKNLTTLINSYDPNKYISEVGTSLIVCLKFNLYVFFSCSNFNNRRGITLNANNTIAIIVNTLMLI